MAMKLIAKISNTQVSKHMKRHQAYLLRNYMAKKNAASKS
jgi:hypothetical protein